MGKPEELEEGQTDSCRHCGKPIVWSSGGVYVGELVWRHKETGKTLCIGVNMARAEPANGAAVLRKEWGKRC